MSTGTYYMIAQAGAGTGKTYALVENYVSALFGFDPSGVAKKPYEILALTFTQKAALEMRLRIAVRVSNLLSSDSILQDSLLVQDHEHIRKIMRALPQSPIGTFHGFCRNVLQEFAKFAQIDENCKLLSPYEEERLARTLLRPLILDELQNNQTMRELVGRFRLGRGLRALGLIDGLLNLYSGLGESNLNLSDLENLVCSHEERKQKVNLKLKNIKSLIKDIFDNSRIIELKNILYDADFDKLTSQEYYASNLFNKLGEITAGNWGPRELRSQIITNLKILGGSLIDYYCFSDEKNMVKIIIKFHDKFQSAKKNLGVLSYSDLLVLTRNLLVSNINVRKNIKQRFKHILVDEYQDTSPIQEDIIGLLSENSQNHEKINLNNNILSKINICDGASLFIVGDKKQSIYGFRGADVSLFDRIYNKLKNNSTNKFFAKKLNINRRSESNILDFINLVSQITLKDQGYSVEDSLVCYEENNCNLDLHNINLWALDDPEKKYEPAAHAVCKLFRDRPNICAQDVVVLVRRNQSAMKIKSELGKLGIPAYAVGGEGFYQRQEIVDFLCVFKLVFDPGNKLASNIIFRSQIILLKDSEILNLSILIGKKTPSLLDALENLDQKIFCNNSVNKLEKIKNLLKYVENNISNLGFGWAFDYLLDNLNLVYKIGLRSDKEQEWANIKKLRNLLISETRNPYEVIEDYNTRVVNSLREPLADCPQKSDAVTIMTVHQAKGLEFNIVVLADLELGCASMIGDFAYENKLGLALRPKNRPISTCAAKKNDIKQDYYKFEKLSNLKKLREQQELARVLYVAMTRAKKELFLICNKNSLEKNSARLSFLSLILRVRKSFPDRFNKLCLVSNFSCQKKININNKEEVEKQNKKINLDLFDKFEVTKKIFASDLRMDKNKKFLCVNITDSKFNNINGNIAHKLLEISLAIITSRECWQAAEITHIVDSIARSLELERKKFVITCAAVTETLMGMQNWLNKFSQIFCERQISRRVNKKIILEGFADVVCVGINNIFVIDFKSSKKLCQSPNTYLQLFAYAWALEQEFQKPVQCAPLLIGSQETPQWYDFDGAAQNLLLDALSHK